MQACYELLNRYLAHFFCRRTAGEELFEEILLQKIKEIKEKMGSAGKKRKL
jgi:hypothetical protein